MTTLISTQGMARAATDCNNDGVGVGGEEMGETSPGQVSSDLRSFEVGTLSQLLDL